MGKGSHIFGNDAQRHAAVGVAYISTQYFLDDGVSWSVELLNIARTQNISNIIYATELIVDLYQHPLIYACYASKGHRIVDHVFKISHWVSYGVSDIYDGPYEQASRAVP